MSPQLCRFTKVRNGGILRPQTGPPLNELLSIKIRNQNEIPSFRIKDKATYEVGKTTRMK